MRDPVCAHRPPDKGLYDPSTERGACGVSFIVDIEGRRSNAIVRQGLEAVVNLLHRGACGCEKNTGDGAGMLIQVPDGFLRRVTAPLGIALPPAGDYGVGMLHLPRDPAGRAGCVGIVERIVAEEGLALLGWRDVPTSDGHIGDSARAVEPGYRQVFVGRQGVEPGDPFERRLFLVRKRAENEVCGSDLPQKGLFYPASFSHRTIVYKGMLTAGQMEAFFPDIREPDVESALALVHQRFSTNTFPNWELAHPFRYIAHNGEINTLRGNINWMHAREALFRSRFFTDREMARLLPVIRPGGSDSAMFDNALEMLVMCGTPLPQAVMMLIPEAWSGHESMSDEKKAFYEFHSCVMEPWDGPASIAFTDGRVIGAVLDRNGLRPSRYWVTKDGLVIMASEVGVLDVPQDRILKKGRLEPGKMFFVDTAQGRIVDDVEIKRSMATAKPYRAWLERGLARLEDLPAGQAPPAPDPGTLLARQRMFGYTQEDLRILIGPMAVKGEEPVGSMGTDTPLAVLSGRPQPLFNYFKQIFAQVTNPPLDAIREELVTSVGTTLGAEGNLLEPGPESCRQIKLASPILSNEELARLSALEDGRGRFRSRVLPMLFPAADGAAGLERAMSDLSRRASEAIAEGVDILILSDRGADASLAPIPSLLATAGVHHHLIRRGERTRVGLVIESGEPREVHHFALLLGYGAGAVNPHLAFESLDDLVRRRVLPPEIDEKKAVKNYVKAVNKGVVKVISKMGISTIQSYRGAQVFEAIGLDRPVIDRYFTWTSSRIRGIGIDVVAAEAIARYREAFPERPAAEPSLDAGGQYQWRRDGEFHLFNPDSIHKLQHAIRAESFGIFKEYSRLIDDQAKHLCTLRGLFEFRTGSPVPLEGVEPAERIMKRFATGAMSYGSISREAHETLAIAMNRIGGKSNTGEGGEDADRYVPLPNGDSKCSAIKQVASARFGVTSEYLVSAKELQIKMAQGAKPGEGGQLPAAKVYPWIAKTRLATPYVGLISPPPHHDIYSIEDLAQLIHDLKNSNPRARIAVKLVAEVGVGTVAAGVSKAHSDVVLISGHDGGTGASPLTSIKHAGIPWELGLAETQQVLVANNLRDRIIVQTDGQMKTGRDVAIAALLGAEEFGFATAPLVAAGCILMRVCHLDTCPVGVATQNPELRKRFAGKPEHVVTFMRFIAEELREIMARLGFRAVDEMIGRTDMLETRKAIDHWKAKGLDFSEIFYRPPQAARVAVRKVTEQDHGLDKALDNRLIALCRPALEDGRKVSLAMPIRNVNRTVGTMLGSEITRRHGGKGLPDGTITLRFTGSAGQSFGAFVPRGVTLLLEGDSNDYLGKGLSGGKIAVFPPKEATFAPEENILVGNVVLYGATSGECYIRGIAGERFAVRNSGAWAVVEGVGDHGCEYMTGGRVAVIGRTGRNFAAGMSGGIAYVLDREGDFARRCNTGMVGLETPDGEDARSLEAMLRRHVEYTGSSVAQRILEDFPGHLARFVKVMPTDYKRVLLEEKRKASARESAAVEAAG